MAIRTVTRTNLVVTPTGLRRLATTGTATTTLQCWPSRRQVRPRWSPPLSKNPRTRTAPLTPTRRASDAASHAHEAVEAEPVAPYGNRAPTRRIVALGLAGGLVPSPSAIVVLLAGFALGRSWFALLLVLAYGVGMAFTLTMIGVIVVRAGGLTRRVAAGGVLPRPVVAVLTRLPLIAACVVMSAGLWLGVRSILAM